MTSPQLISRPFLLIGEGQEEFLFFSALTAHLGISNIQIEQYHGKTNLARYIRALPARSGFDNLSAIGITRDADDNSSGAFQSICASLRAVNLSIPHAHGEIVGSNPKIGAFILPDGSTNGMLENLCLNSLNNSPELVCIDELFRCLDRLSIPNSKNANKARLNAWLSTRIEPDKRLGHAALSGYFDLNNIAFAPISKFLRDLTT